MIYKKKIFFETELKDNIDIDNFKQVRTERGKSKHKGSVV